MYVPTTALELWLYILTISAAFSVTLSAMTYAVWKANDMKKRWLVTIPEVIGGLATIRRVKPRRGEITIKKGDEGETFILMGDSAYPTNRGPLHVISEYGANLVAPTKDEAFETGAMQPLKSDSKTYARFRVNDPSLFWKAKRENLMEKLFSSNAEKQHWLVAVAPFALIAVGVLSLGFIYVIVKLLPAIQAAGHG